MKKPTPSATTEANSLASTIKKVKAIVEDDTLPNMELIREYIAEARQAFAEKWAIEDEEEALENGSEDRNMLRYELRASLTAPLSKGGEK